MSKSSIKNWKGTAVVMGVDWGDSGKGRLIDDLSARADIIARYNGGANTGHSINNKYGKFALHIIPSGIFNSKALNLVGRNVLLDCESLEVELNNLKTAKVSTKNLIIDPQATLVMPWHKMRDGIREKFRSNYKVGTTGKGVGPAYADRTERVGILVFDLVSIGFRKKLFDEVKIQNKFFNLKLNAEKIYRDYQRFAKMLRPFTGNTIEVLNKALIAKKNILFEGAQGYFLDIDAGTYPFVTSSNPGVIGIWRSYDLHPSNIKHVIGITKAYTTRVGNGPMPTKMDEETSKFIVTKGLEVGTTTGRTRSPGWLDLVLIKAANESNKLTSLAITKLDVLSGLDKLKLCTGYKLNGKPVDYISHDSEFLAKVTPTYTEFAGWKEDISTARLFTNLPKNAQKYIKAIENFTKIPVHFISVGPKRGEVIYV